MRLSCRRLPLMIVLSLMIFLHSPLFSADEGAGREQLEKREKIRYAIDKGILSIYDIPFNTYVRLGMWDEIDHILAANNQNAVRYALPDAYYSRPYLVNDQIWIFENADHQGVIYVFDPETLELRETRSNETFNQYEGGIRAVFGDLIVSGGSDRDVDMAVVWHLKTDEVKTLRLEKGHYIGSLHVAGGRLYIGACGGVVNAWRIKDWKYLGSYFTQGEESDDWEEFNQRECISALTVFRDRLIGVGEKHVFEWNMENRRLIRQYPKSLNNAIVVFYGDEMVEYKHDLFAVRRLDNVQDIRAGRADKPIADLRVTSETILPEQAGPVMMLALRHNKGIQVYDFHTLERVAGGSMPYRGQMLNAFQGQIYATDDRMVYTYDVRRRAPEQYAAFLDTIRLDQIPMTEAVFFQLLKRFRTYPDVIPIDTISRQFMERNGLRLQYRFRYGKIGERFVYDVEMPGEAEGYQEELFGYRIQYALENESDTAYYLTLMFEWCGYYGEPRSTLDPDQPRENNWHTFLLPPGGEVTDAFVVGEREPYNLFIYPVKMEPIPRDYYDGLMLALSDKNRDVEMIDRYLNDHRAKQWHPELLAQKERILTEQDGFFGGLNLMP